MTASARRDEFQANSRDERQSKSRANSRAVGRRWNGFDVFRVKGVAG